MNKKIGRPKRIESRDTVSTFLPLELKQKCKIKAKFMSIDRNITLSDWFELELNKRNAHDYLSNRVLNRTHPRKEDGWCNCNLKLSTITAQSIRELSIKYDISVAALIFNLIKIIEAE